MANFGLLRVVPMLIKAYHDAQVQISATKPNETQLNMRAAAANKKIPLTLPAKTQDKKPTKAVHGKNKRNSPISIHSGPKDVTSRLLREIRATNRKLKDLDDVQRQLSSLSSTLDDFKRKLGELDKQPESKVNPDAQAAHYPAPLPPFRNLSEPHQVPLQVNQSPVMGMNGDYVSQENYSRF